MRIVLTRADGSREIRDDRTLDEARAEAVARVRAGFEAAIAGGWLHAASGKLMQVDEASTTRMTQMALAAEVNALPAGFAWRAADNSAVPLTREQMIDMAAEVGRHVFALRTRMWTGVEAARAAASVAAADAVAF
jgi:hypothetical protein